MKEINYEVLIEKIKYIEQREPEAARALVMVVEHINGTYSDKYDKGLNVIDTKKQLYGENGTAINVYQVTRYLQRYITSGSKKSYLLVDLFKAIHYIIFEITRRVRNEEIETIEPKH